MEPLKVSEQAKVGIVGAGLMGHAIAQVFAANSFSVLLFDSNRQVLEAAPDRIRANFSAFLDLGLATPDDVDRTLSLVRLCPDLEEATSDAEVVVEAVSENLPLKQKIFAELEGYVRPEAILCSNTSAISISLIAEPLGRKERLVGTHFWNPPHIVPCVEVIRSRFTSETVFESRVPIDETDR